MDTLIDKLDILTFAKDCKDYDIDLFNIEAHGLIKVYGNEDHPALFLKEVESFNFETSKTIAEIHKICWNYQKVIFLYVYTKAEIRIYNCSERPFEFNNNIQHGVLERQLNELELYACTQSDKEKFEILNTLFSRLAIDTGFLWTSERAFEIKSKIKLEKRVDKTLIQSLINLSKALESNGLKDKDLIHRLIMRSLFLLYLEDKKATTQSFYTQFSKTAISYFDILNNKDATYSLYKRLSEDFNGSLFNLVNGEKNLVNAEHLTLIRQCFINGNVNNPTELFPNWRLFNFSIIRIELLSEIYENFLSQLNEKNKKDSGTFYTPPSLVELILNEKLPIKNNETDCKVKTLDPSCGSGIFLVQSFKRLIKRYENKHYRKLNDFTVLVDILKSNIYGIEIDPKSVKVAAFSLYLALLDNLDPKTGWWNGAIEFPYLINDPKDKSLKEQGENLFVRDTISDLYAIKELQNFDLVVGNPPFGVLLSEKEDNEKNEGKQKDIRAYCDREKFAKEMVLPFLHKATFFSPKGQIALIFNTKLLTNNESPYQNFRHWLFNENNVEKIYNFSIFRKSPEVSGGQLFNSASVPISIVFYKNEIPENQTNHITYYAPKTYIKNNFIEGIILDSADVKHLPRIECEKKDTKIWKIAMWGSFYDFEFLKKVNDRHVSFQEHFKKNNIQYRTGLNADSDHPDFMPEKLINAKKIARYYTEEIAENIVKNDSKYYRKISDQLFEPPYIVLKRFQKEKELVASYIDYNAYCTTTGIIINENLDNENKKNIVGLINSQFSRYYMFMIASSWGIEREQINSDEYIELPFIFENSNKEVAEKVSEIISIKKSNKLNKTIAHLEKKIDGIIYNDILKLTEDEKILIV